MARSQTSLHQKYKLRKKLQLAKIVHPPQYEPPKLAINNFGTTFRRKAKAVSIQIQTEKEIPSGLSFDLKVGEIEILPEKESQKESIKPSVAFFYSSPIVFPVISNIDHSDVLQPLPVIIDYKKEMSEIIKSMKGTNRKIPYKVGPCTLTSFVLSLNTNLRGLHFSGHGLKNASHIGKDYSFKEGDMLLLEDDVCKGYFLSCRALKKILESYGTKLEFVFVSSCHSGLIGHVFLAAGVNHVICVKRNSSIADKVAVEFSKKFYSALFRSSLTVCEAFSSVKAQMGGDPFLKEESDKFYILCKRIDDDHICEPFNKFAPGECQEIKHTPLYDELPLRILNFIDRSVDLYKLANDIKDMRMISIKGEKGIGKSAFVNTFLHSVFDRDFFFDGIISIDCNSFSENLEWFQALTEICEAKNKGPTPKGNEKKKIIENPSFVESMIDYEGIPNKKMTNHLNSFLKGREILILLDNVDQILGKHDMECRKLLKRLLMKNEKIRIIITSRDGIGVLREIPSKEITLTNLSEENTALLLETISRNFETNEKQKLMNISANLSPEVKEFKDHDLFRQLSGHPESIVYAADLLHDRDLSELYHMIIYNNFTAFSCLREKETYIKLKKSLNQFKSIQLKKIARKKQSKDQLSYNFTMTPATPLLKFQTKSFKTKKTFAATEEGALELLLTSGQASIKEKITHRSTYYSDSSVSNEERKDKVDLLENSFQRPTESLNFPIKKEKKKNSNSKSKSNFYWEENSIAKIERQQTLTSIQNPRQGKNGNKLQKNRFDIESKVRRRNGSFVGETIDEFYTILDSSQEIQEEDDPKNVLFRMFYLIIRHELEDIEFKMERLIFHFGTKIEIIAYLNKYLGTVSLLKEVPEKALKYFEDSKSQFKKLKNLTGVAASFLGLGIAHCKYDNIQEANNKLNSSVKIFDDIQYYDANKIRKFVTALLTPEKRENNDRSCRLKKIIQILLEIEEI